MAKIYAGRRKFNRLISHLDGIDGVLRAEAETVEGKASAILDSAERRTGTAKITVTKGDLDYYVNLVDENAMTIEYGRNGALDHGTSRGLFPLHRAAGLPYEGGPTRVRKRKRLKGKRRRKTSRSS